MSQSKGEQSRFACCRREPKLFPITIRRTTRLLALIAPRVVRTFPFIVFIFIIVTLQCTGCIINVHWMFRDPPTNGSSGPTWTLLAHWSKIYPTGPGMEYEVSETASGANNNKTFVEIVRIVEKFWKYRRVAENGPERPWNVVTVADTQCPRVGRISCKFGILCFCAPYLYL